MVTYAPAKPEQQGDMLQLLQEYADAHLERTRLRLQMTQAQFIQLLAAVGRPHAIYQDGELAGFYSVEERESELCLHLLMLKKALRCQGIVRQTLAELEARYRDAPDGLRTTDVIETKLPESDVRARTAYERLGYETVQVLHEVGILVMRRHLSNGSSAGP